MYRIGLEQSYQTHHINIMRDVSIFFPKNIRTVPYLFVYAFSLKILCR